MSVLKKLQFADASTVGAADFTNIGAGVVECQKPVRITNVSRIAPCSTAVR
jgi:hypothetical protein